MPLRYLLYTTALLLLYGIPSAWHSNGLADYGGLFIIDQSDKSFSASYYQLTDSVEHENILVYAKYQYFQYDASWVDFWTLSLNQKQHIGNVRAQSRFRYLSLGIYASTLPWLASSFGIHTPDSSFFADTKIGKGEPTIAKMTWDPEEGEEKSDLVSKIQGNWKSNLFNKSVGVGGIYRNHFLYGKISRLQSMPKNQEETYYIRDSVDIYTTQLRYQLTLNKAFFNLEYFHLKSDACLVGIHKEEQDAKRFLYLPLNSSLNLLMFSLEQTHWFFRGGLVNFYLDIEKDNRRFYESLAPNRLLSASVSQALSFSFLQKTYRLYGSVEGTAVLAGLAYYWDFPIEKWTLTPKLGSDFFWATANVKMKVKSATTKMVISIEELEEFYWDLESFGTNANLSITLKAPHSRFYVQAKASQIIPFYFRNEKKHFFIPLEEPSEKTLMEKPEGSFSMKPFHNGFTYQMQMGASF